MEGLCITGFGPSKYLVLGVRILNKLFGENFRAFSPLWPSDRAQLLAMPDPWMLGIFLLGIGHYDTMEHTNKHFWEDFSLAHTSWGPRLVVASCRFKI